MTYAGTKQRGCKGVQIVANPVDHLSIAQYSPQQLVAFG